MELRLDGRAAVITGGGKGLGLSDGPDLAQAGGGVAILARNPEAPRDRPRLESREVPRQCRRFGVTT